MAFTLRSLWRIRRIAFTAIWAHRLRSSFVIAAIALGIASLTVIVAAVDGAQKKAREITSDFGPDAALIFGGDVFNRAVGQRLTTLTHRDARSIRQMLPGVYLVVPMRSKQGITAKANGNNVEVGRVIGSTANYAEAWNWPLSLGRDFTQPDVDRGARVCLLGVEPAQILFGRSDPIGRTVFLNDIPFTVTGVLSERGTSSPNARMDDRIIVPLTTLTQRFNMDRRYFPALRVKFTNAEAMEEHKEGLRSLLRHLHNLRDNEPDDFSIITADEVMKFLAMLQGSLVVFLGITAASAMVVGGFVLANLLYLSIAERQMEIGLRKAMGARNSAIVMQFLIESVALTVIGSLLGLGLGIVLGKILSGFDLIELQLSWKVFFIGVASAVAVGIIFGLRPARNAATLDPIRALRGDA
ncbi:ABC transporter permease [Oleidesulfovibrio sp.]|uniref:ABC transporter permease n=1 Tax=Oleidesulfovibrio sp. TaxID=2909707 RepID=UPI003A8B9618